MLTIIAAVAPWTQDETKFVIGKDGEIPWYLKEDLLHFKEVTGKHAVIMGTETYTSILRKLGKPLPGRIHFVLTRDPERFHKKLQEQDMEVYKIHEQFKDRIIFCKSLAQAHQRAEVMNSEVFVIGGERVYLEAMQFTPIMYITEIKKAYDGDAFFPSFDRNLWDRTVTHETEDFAFVTYSKLNP